MPQLPEEEIKRLLGKMQCTNQGRCPGPPVCSLWHPPGYVPDVVYHAQKRSAPMSKSVDIRDEDREMKEAIAKSLEINCNLCDGIFPNHEELQIHIIGQCPAIEDNNNSQDDDAVKANEQKTGGDAAIGENVATTGSVIVESVNKYADFNSPIPWNEQDDLEKSWAEQEEDEEKERIEEENRRYERIKKRRNNEKVDLVFEVPTNAKIEERPKRARNPSQKRKSAIEEEVEKQRKKKNQKKKEKTKNAGKKHKEIVIDGDSNMGEDGVKETGVERGCR